MNAPGWLSWAVAATTVGFSLLTCAAAIDIRRYAIRIERLAARAALDKGARR